jgi:predicted ATPase
MRIAHVIEVAVLDYMRDAHPELFASFQEDTAWLLNHIERLEVRIASDREARLSIYEAAHANIEAPTISLGTARAAAIVAGYYSLDFDNTALPGLVIIEEPDTALNPGLLSKFVSLLRDYTSDPEKPRQFIMTTHNPSFLSLFQPEEVRVVSRDDDGYTKVEPIPSHIKEVWLDEYGLGEVWSTRSFGGLPD